MLVRGLALLMGMLMSNSAAAQTPPAPLVLEAKIPLGEVGGRIDHLAVDLKRQRLFVAELGNNSLGVVDLASRKVLRRIAGLSEPQGVGYEPATDTVYVANAKDGSVQIFRGEDLSALGRIDLGDDADNVRIDAVRNRVIVGYGNGSLAIIDPTTRTKLGDIRLKAHPESFQIDGDRVFVNVPDARAIEIADLAKGEVVGLVPTRLDSANFPSARRTASSWCFGTRRASS
jgi:YVTN family beta-propeller protein